MLRKIVAVALTLGVTSMFGMSIEELNHADKATLMQINGIGNAKADAIIKAREKKDFTSFAEVMGIKGVGTKLVENIKNDVKVKGKATKTAEETQKN